MILLYAASQISSFHKYSCFSAISTLTEREKLKRGLTSVLKNNPEVDETIKLIRIKSFFPYKDRFNRSQKSKIVYKASCWDCDAFYVGKTKRRLPDRKTEHFKALTQIGHASAVAEHSISTGHNIKWDHFEILASGQCDLQCKIKATLLIRDLKPALSENVGSENLLLY